MTTDTPLPTTGPDAPITRSFSLTVDRAALATRAQNDERVPIAISSEYPVRRYDWARDEFFNEVLDHSAGGVDMSRASRGLPFISVHNTYSGEMFGRVEDITLGADRVLRGWIRFSRAQRAQEIRQDMLDDIRTDVSVGYNVGEYTEERGADGTLTRRYRNWTPYEVSTVPIPADPTVGKGRAHGAATERTTASPARGETMSTNATTVVESPAAPVQATQVQERAEPGMSREASILSMGAAAGLSAEETSALVRSGRSAHDVGLELLDKMNRAAVHASAPKPAVTLTEKENQRYSIRAAIAAAVNGTRDGFEFEVSQEFAKQTGRALSTEKSFFLPFSVRTQLSVGTANKGGELRATELRPELIDLLRQKSLALGTLGANFMPGLVGNVAFPRQTAGATATWVAEAPGSDMSLSSLSLDQVTLSPKGLQAATTVSRQLLAQSTPAADALIFEDIMKQHGVAVDTAIFYGTGASNQPTGVGVASGTNLVAIGTNGGQATLAKILEMLRVLETSNSRVDGIAFVTTPGIKYSMAAIARFASTDSKTLWDIDTNTVMGEAGYSTNNLPSTLTKGTSSGVCHAAILGDWSQVMVGEWGAGAEIIVDPYSLALRNLVRVSSIQFVDVQVRTPASFAVCRDLLV